MTTDSGHKLHALTHQLQETLGHLQSLNALISTAPTAHVSLHAPVRQQHCDRISLPRVSGLPELAENGIRRGDAEGFETPVNFHRKAALSWLDLIAPRNAWAGIWRWLIWTECGANLPILLTEHRQNASYGQVHEME